LGIKWSILYLSAPLWHRTSMHLCWSFPWGYQHQWWWISAHSWFVPLTELEIEEGCSRWRVLCSQCNLCCWYQGFLLTFRNRFYWRNSSSLEGLQCRRGISSSRLFLGAARLPCDWRFSHYHPLAFAIPGRWTWAGEYWTCHLGPPPSLGASLVGVQWN